jgi:hypothetical protein
MLRAITPGFALVRESASASRLLQLKLTAGV